MSAPSHPRPGRVPLLVVLALTLCASAALADRRHRGRGGGPREEVVCHEEALPGASGCNYYGCWTNGGGCNYYGCWHGTAGSCNYFGCSDVGACDYFGCPQGEAAPATRLVCTSAPAWERGRGRGRPSSSPWRREAAGCNVYGCYQPGGGCNVYGCFTAGGGCSVYGCWAAGGACNVYGCSDVGACSVYGCP